MAAVAIDVSRAANPARAVRSRRGPAVRPPRTGPRRSARPGPCGPGRCGPGRPGRGRGVVRVGRHRAEDRVRAGLPAAGHLALAAPGHRHHPPGRRRGLRRLRPARLAGPRPDSQRPDPAVRQVVGDLLLRSRLADKSPTICRPKPGSRRHRGRSPRSCRACRSWSWPWGPRWPTCCAPTPRPWMYRTAGPDHGRSGGPRPGLRRTRTDQAADNPKLTGTGPLAGTRLVPSRDDRAAAGLGDLTRGPRSHRCSRPALSPAGSPEAGRR